MKEDEDLKMTHLRVRGEGDALRLRVWEEESCGTQ
jgi:hypothetical protein